MSVLKFRIKDACNKKNMIMLVNKNFIVAINLKEAQSKL